MTKKEQKAVNKFFLKLLKTGAFVDNTSLPKKMWASPKGKFQKYGQTAVLTRSQLINEWTKLRKQLEA